MDNSWIVFLGDDFKTDNDLKMGCLVLQIQVKSINGNETNILIPQTWMQKYIEDQKRGIDRSVENQSQVSTLSLKRTPSNFFFFKFRTF